MAQLSISIDVDTEKRLEQEVAQGDFQSKSEFVKKALIKYMRDLAYERVLQAQREYKEGKAIELRGTLAKHIRSTKI
jgi:Arc/MetJ-type ribon-helix-helix transcriptional regulator